MSLVNRLTLNWLVFVGLLVVTLGSFGSFRTLYSSQFMPNQQNAVPTLANKDKVLYGKIKAYAQEYKVASVDARVDPVWKAIPGYNGREVDINASYKEMSASKKFVASQVVYREVPPKVHLKDLPPNPIFRGNPKKPMVALMINVAWGNEYLPQMLKTLNQYHVKATFFLDGSWVKKNPKLALMISEEGHSIGNHAYSHPDLKTKSKAETIDQLKKTNETIEAVLDVKPIYFAPPSGSFNKQTVDVAHSLGMHTVLWTVDTVDWKHPNPNDMVERVTNKVEAGSMVLMHPTKETAEALAMIIQEIEDKGYQLGTVPDLLSEARVDE
jgi:probable sporulation protein (polysaccharide deacetylase family)